MKIGAVALFLTVLGAAPGAAQKPDPKRGAIFVSSVPPPGAEVFVDSELRGKTPLEVRLLAPGDHLVEVKLEGYGAVERVVAVEAGKTQNLVVRLVQGAGRLKVDAPPGSPVYVDGLYAGRAPGPLWLSPGKHHARVLPFGLPVFTSDIEIKPNEETTLAPNFAAHLVVETKPEGVAVLVDGKEAGKSPLRVQVAPGKHRVLVNEPRFEPVEREVEAALAKDTRVEITLRGSRRLWSVPLAGARGRPRLVQGLALWRTESGIVAHDAQTGLRRWEYKAPLGKPAAMTIHGAHLFVVLAVGQNGALAAVKLADGTQEWLLEVRGVISGGPAFLEKPPLFVLATESGRIYARESGTGKGGWELLLDKKLGAPYGSPVAVADHVAFATRQGWAVGASARGRLAWKFRIGAIPPQPASVVAGTALFWGAWTPGPRSMAFGLDGRSGAKTWSHAIAGATAHPLVALGEIVLASEGQKLVGIRRQGGRLFSLDLGAAPAAPLAIAGGAVVAAGATLRKVDAAGKSLWDVALEGEPCPPVATERLVVTAVGDELLAFGAADGKKRWSFRMPARSCDLAAEGDAVVLTAGDTALRLDASGE
jgi:outer membrane protein assembly factor BamB